MSSQSSPQSKPSAWWESSLPYKKLKVKDVEFKFSIPNSKALWIAEDAANREPELYDWIDSSLTPNSLFIDVGANFGLYSLYAALKTNCKVVAFEPHFATYYILYRNIVLNNIAEKIALYPMAITNSPNSRTTFRLKDLSAGRALNTLVPTATDPRSISQVEKDIDKLNSTIATNSGMPFYQPVISTSLDAFIDQNNLEYNFKNFENVSLKIDVDGLDFLVLAGALQSLSGISNLIVEYLPDQIKMHSLIPSLVEQYNFNIVQRTDVNLILSRP